MSDNPTTAPISPPPAPTTEFTSPPTIPAQSLPPTNTTLSSIHATPSATPTTPRGGGSGRGGGTSRGRGIGRGRGGPSPSGVQRAISDAQYNRSPTTTPIKPSPATTSSSPLPSTESPASPPSTSETTLGPSPEGDTTAPTPEGGESTPAIIPLTPVRKIYPDRNRVATGGEIKEKLTPEELDAKMAAMRLQNEKISVKRAAVEADESEFKAVAEADRARAEALRAAEKAEAVRVKKVESEKKERAQSLQTQINAERAQTAARKLEKVNHRAWDREKLEPGPERERTREPPRKTATPREGFPK